ncbi:MAG: histidine kinase N-terminal 7TM domain-containing protein [Bacteroidia bacterium]
MISANQLLQFLLIITAGLALTVALSALRRRKIPGAVHFSVLMFAISWWAACDAIQYGFESHGTKVFLAQLSYIGIVIAPVVWVSFIYTYSQIKLNIPFWFRYAVFVFCAVFLLFVFTNSYHHLVYRSWDMEAHDFALSYQYGPLFWMWVAVSYFCLLAGTIRLIITAVRSVTLLRANMILIIVGALFPWFGNITYITGLNPINGFDPTPVGFAITGVIGLIVIFRKKLFNYVPLAYQSLFLNLNDAALVLDWKGEIIESNIKAKALSRKKLLKNQNFMNFCHSIKENPEPELLNYLKFEGNEGPELEIALPGRGMLKWVLVRGQRIGQEQDEKRGFILNIRDITLWRKQKNSLERSAGLLGLSGRFAGEMLRRSNWQSVYSEYAPNFRTLCKANGNFICTEPEYEKYFTGVITQESRIWKQTWTNQLHAYSLDKPVVDYFELGTDAFIVLPLDLDRKIIGYWVFFWGLDDREIAQEVQDVLKLASNVLSSSIENQINGEKLHQAKEEAEEASRAKSDFLSVMSHEIRTPLNAVTGISHILKEENKDPNLVEMINTLNNSAENLLILINDILDYNKIEAGKLELAMQSFSPVKLLTVVAEENEYRAREHQNKFEFTHDEGSDGFYLGDRTRLGQVLNNLISNAVKFTENGTISISLKKKQSLGKFDVLRFEVKDSGMGIDEAFLPKLFDKFTQATSASTRKFGGTGLGLAICQSLLGLMDTKLEVLSKVNEGSTFWFDLKLERISAKEVMTSETPKELEKGLAGMRVLIVEDNLVNVFVCQNFMKKWGVVSEVAENGELGVDMVKKGKYDCILMDIQMPVMDGYEATRLIREFDADIPIVALTASAMMDRSTKSRYQGMNDFVSKPFRPDELFEALVKYKP